MHPHQRSRLLTRFTIETFFFFFFFPRLCPRLFFIFFFLFFLFSLKSRRPPSTTLFNSTVLNDLIFIFYARGFHPVSIPTKSNFFFIFHFFCFSQFQLWLRSGGHQKARPAGSVNHNELQEILTLLLFYILFPLAGR